MKFPIVLFISLTILTMSSRAQKFMVMKGNALFADTSRYDFSNEIPVYVYRVFVDMKPDSVRYIWTWGNIYALRPAFRTGFLDVRDSKSSAPFDVNVELENMKMMFIDRPKYHEGVGIPTILDMEFAFQPEDSIVRYFMRSEYSVLEKEDTLFDFGRMLVKMGEDVFPVMRYGGFDYKLKNGQKKAFCQVIYHDNRRNLVVTAYLRLRGTEIIEIYPVRMLHRN